MKTNNRLRQDQLQRRINQNPHNQDFACLKCRYPVSASALVSRVQNRNHCPYCLWSRHLDLFEAGDRLSACKGGMQPIGLAFKRVRNRYAAPFGGPHSGATGELMIVHRCLECGKISLNRCAADDDPALILSLPALSVSLCAEILAQIKAEGIELVSVERIAEVRRQIEGIGACA